MEAINFHIPRQLTSITVAVLCSWSLKIRFSYSHNMHAEELLDEAHRMDIIISDLSVILEPSTCRLLLLPSSPIHALIDV